MVPTLSSQRLLPSVLLCQVLLFFLAPTTDGFGGCNPAVRCLSSARVTYPLFMTSEGNELENDDDDEEITPVVGRPVSRMTNFAAQFLDKIAEEESQSSDEESGVDDDDNARIARATLENIEEATHLVAIPLEASHELLIELESVQRAILHHCPILLDACISGTTTRLPLLYIKAPNSDLKDNAQNSASVTTALAGTVRRLVKKHIYGASKKQTPEQNEDEETENVENESLNAEGYRPLTMTFQSLEIDGANNNILNTVGTLCVCEEDETDEEDEEENDKVLPNFNERRFENFIKDLQSAIAAQGWKMAFPPDPNREEYEQTGSTNLSFRPRVAFMELPKKFDENISKFKSNSAEITEEDMKFLRAEEGGNGVSPIFFANWLDDTFARNVRLQEIGIYPTNPLMADPQDSTLLRNAQFYIPFETIGLPSGTDDMTSKEKKFLDYHEKRMKETEEEFRKENFPETAEVSDSPLSPGSSKSSEPDILMTKTRNRLESIYLQDSEINDINDLGLIEESEATSQTDGGTTNDGDDEEDLSDIVAAKDETRSTEDDYMEDWMRQRIMQVSNKSKDNEEKDDVDITQESSAPDSKPNLTESESMEQRMEEKVKNAVNSLGSMKSREDVQKEPKYSIEDNPIFKKFKEEGTLSDEKPKASPTKTLGPYPGNDHFVGIWKVVVNPLGDDEGGSIEEGSENLLLRVDGTTAAGPTLNPDTKQKAAGGTWKMLPQENGDVLLRIRLIIPPEKKRILVMEGLVKRGAQLGMKMASRTFGIPQVEEKANAANKDEEVKMMCSGEAYIEDAVTKKNRIRAENFYLEKLQGGRDPDSYTITIPKTIRRLD